MEHTGKILIRRGTQISKTSAGYGLELAIPFGIAGIALAELARRRWSEPIITRIYSIRPIFTLPTYLSLAGTIVGIGATVLGLGLVGFGRMWNRNSVKLESESEPKPNLIVSPFYYKPDFKLPGSFKIDIPDHLEIHHP